MQACNMLIFSKNFELRFRYTYTRFENVWFYLLSTKKQNTSFGP